MRATELLSILSIDFKYKAISKIKIEVKDQFYSIESVVKQQEELIFIASETNDHSIEIKELVTTLMLNKSQKLIKFKDKFEPIYGCRVVQDTLVL